MRALRTAGRGVAAFARAALWASAGASAGLAARALGVFVLALPLDLADAPEVARDAFLSVDVSAAAAAVAGAVVGLLTAKGAWRFGGVVALVALSCVVAGFFAYAFGVALPQVPDASRWVSVPLLLVEAVSLSMALVYAFYGMDAYARRRWRRNPARVAHSRYYLPRVAFHVACFNEPPDLVKQSLRALQRLDYPDDRYVIMVLDDSTKAECREPLEAYCRENGLVYVHREDRRGYKAGALNHALTLTPPDVELVCVLDADYQLEPDFLKDNVGYFVNPNLGFLQTPQDYRNREQSFLTRQYYFADAYFYRAVLPSRNEENTIIFCGTMGIIRRSTLEGVGGWGEEFITEDSELSVRVLERGYDSLYVNRTYGRGLIPPTFDAYKKQLYRWSFGSVKVIKAHLKEFLFSHLSVRQKFDFFVGNLHWFDGLWVCGIAFSAAALAVADLAGWTLVNHHREEIWLLGLVPLAMLVDGIVRLHIALRTAVGLPFRRSLGVMGMWYAIKFNNMFAAVKSLLGFRMPFVRTPKAPEERPGRLRSLGLAVRLATFELACGLALLAIAGASAYDAWRGWDAVGMVPWPQVVLASWIVFYATLFLVAPWYAYKSFATFRPEEDPPAPKPAPSRARGRAAQKG